MNENNTVKELEDQAKNTRYLINRLVKAAYGVDMDEIIRILSAVRGDGENLLPGERK